MLGKDGGALPKMLLPYRLGIGGRIGHGKQWLPWIHIDDMSRLIAFCIDNDKISGAVNACAPHLVTFHDFGKIAAKVLKRPHWLPLPAFALRTVLGEMSSLLLEGQHALPAKALENDFVFQYPQLEDALKALIHQAITTAR